MNRRAMTSREVIRTLRDYESRNVTHLDPAGGWPAVWARARGCRVWDPEGREYLDLTAAFGVAAAGHANPRVVRAGQRQMALLPHAMGDVHPHPAKALLARRLSELTFGRWRRRRPAVGGAGPGRGRVILGSSGFEAVEAALKTALLATGRSRVLAFEGGYHGLGYGALNVTHRAHFRSPFERQLPGFGTFLPFPGCAACGCPRSGCDALPAVEAALGRELARGDVGAVLVEPVQARGGIRVPHRDFLRRLRTACDTHGALLVVDEIYTGFGRTGAWFAVEHSGVVPDLICLGKALAGGFPISACVGRADVMDSAWPASDGEAIHTSTFLGNPVGCAMALAQLDEIEHRDLPGRSAVLGDRLLGRLNQMADAPWPWVLSPRGSGLMAGVGVHDPDGRPATATVIRVMKRLLRDGYVVLPEGADSEVLGFTPPLTITATQIDRAVAAVRAALVAEQGMPSAKIRRKR